MFTQIVNPTGNLLLTWIIALFPVVALLILLAVVRLSAWAATLIGSIPYHPSVFRDDGLTD